MLVCPTCSVDIRWAQQCEKSHQQITDGHAPFAHIYPQMYKQKQFCHPS